MVSVKKNVRNLNSYAWESVLFVLKPLIIVGVICIPLTVFFLIVEYLPNKEPLGYGYGLLLVLLAVVLIVVRVFFSYKKTLKLFFRDADTDGNVELTICIDNDEYVIENVSSKTVNRIKKSDVKKVKALKKCVFIKMVGNRFVFFPKTDEILNLFVEN